VEQKLWFGKARTPCLNSAVKDATRCSIGNNAGRQKALGSGDFHYSSPISAV